MSSITLINAMPNRGKQKNGCQKEALFFPCNLKAQESKIVCVSISPVTHLIDRSQKVAILTNNFN